MLMSYLDNYLIFILKILTVMFGVIFVLSVMTKGKGRKLGKLLISSLDLVYQEQHIMMARKTLSRKEFKKLRKIERSRHKALKKSPESLRRVFVLDFCGDIGASQVDSLSKEVNAILAIANSRDEVLIRLESPGGVVNGYGLAAAHLDRIKKAGIHLVVAVDQVAASGGYMMASVANQIIASPFAVVGSIGVVGQIPNINRLLNNNGIDIELHTAGRHKRSLTMLGENTEQGRTRFKEELQIIHQIFKEHISSHRPLLDIDSVATGEYWYGKSALSLNMVDRLITSDAYLFDKYKENSHQIFTVSYKTKKSKILSLYRSLSRSLMHTGL
jgi:serine protease SohB